jgi:hypothetical protein
MPCPLPTPRRTIPIRARQALHITPINRPGRGEADAYDRHGELGAGPQDGGGELVVAVLGALEDDDLLQADYAADAGEDAGGEGEVDGEALAAFDLDVAEEEPGEGGEEEVKEGGIAWVGISFG